MSKIHHKKANKELSKKEGWNANWVFYKTEGAKTGCNDLHQKRREPPIHP